MLHGTNNRFRVITMPVPQQDSRNGDEHLRSQFENVMQDMMPKLTSMMEAALASERVKAEKPPESWLKSLFSPKNVLSLIALTFSLGGAFALWSEAIVTEEKLDAKMAPIIEALGSNSESIQKIQESVSTLVELDKHQQAVIQARNAVTKFNDEYNQRIGAWTKNKARPYPEKNAEHIKAEILLEDLLRSRK